MKTGLTKQEKTTDIWFDEKDPTIYIRTHNTDLKNRLKAYSRRFPSVCKLADEDRETGCMEFEIAKGRFSFRLTAPYSEERRRAASEQGKRSGIQNITKYCWRRISPSPMRTERKPGNAPSGHNCGRKPRNRSLSAWSGTVFR